MRELHPCVPLVTLLCLLLLSAFSTDPFVVGCSLGGGLLLGACLGVLRRQLPLVLTVVLLFAVVSGLFSNRGDTVLFYLNHNAITLDALWLGARMGGMMASALCWFVAFGKILDTQKILYLLGRVAPKTALLLSAALRMIPVLRRRHKAVGEARTCADMGEGMGEAGSRLSVSLGLALESAVLTGESMKARGYGLKGRTSYHLFRFSARDGVWLGGICALAVLSAVGLLTGTPWCFALLCILPALGEGRENLRWRS